MKKVLKNKYFYLISYHGLSVLSILMMLIMFSLETTKGESVWKTMSIYQGVSGACLVCFIAFILNLIVCIGSTVFCYLKHRRRVLYIPTVFQIIVHVLILFLHVYFKIFNAGAICCWVFSMLFLLGSFAILIIEKILKLYEEPKPITSEKAPVSKYKRVLLILCIVSMILILLVFFIPIYTTTKGLRSTSYFLIRVLGSTSYGIDVHIIFMVMFLAVFGNVIYFLTILPCYFNANQIFNKKSKRVVYANMIISLLFFLVGFCFTFYLNMKGKNASTISYIPFILMLVYLVVYAFIQGRFEVIDEKEELEKDRKNQKFKIEPLIYILLFTIITFVSLFFNIIEVEFKAYYITQNVKLNGFDLLKTYEELGAGYQVLAFLLFSFEFISGMLLILSVGSFFGKYKDYYKVIKVSAYINMVFMLILGLSGIYFKISQKINEDNIKTLFEAYNVSFAIEYEYTIRSQTIYTFIIAAVVFAIMLIRGQLNLSLEEMPLAVAMSSSKESELPNAPMSYEEPKEIFFDPCPAFTELDQKKSLFEQDLVQRKENLFTNLTLPNLVRFIVDYARESRLHLSYTLEDIATFVAGLGASRLTILQGMSGTGKTSLPKIFAEAIFGNCEIVEVESSWRDKNELLGYYNEFSKCFTPKKFTQCLYKAKLNQEIPTFIVLDEMNLSRIEYYFSDFLSLMEHEEDKREIKLLNVKLARVAEEGTFDYLCLTDGHTLKIPTNVWFIGTANRDESTFEISDKVYDRAQTMNFNKRAPKIHSFSEAIPPKFISYEMFSALLVQAKESSVFDAESNDIVRKVEKLLTPYNISFGNRILNQMEDFVKIYCACFGDREAVLNDAVEKILLSKVVSKLEFKVVENKEKLAIQFDNLGLTSCSAFVRKLNED